MEKITNYLNVYKVTASPKTSYIERIIYYVGEDFTSVEEEVKRGGYYVKSIEHMFQANYRGTGV